MRTDSPEGFRTADGEHLLAEIARQSELSRRTLGHIKNLMSGVFKHAKRIGAINGINPMQDVSLPKARPAAETYAYSLEEILQMISLLPEPAATIVATAAFTGLRKSELRGLLWENFQGDALWITQSVWERFVNEPKTERSKGAVPVIAPLAERLESIGKPKVDPKQVSSLYLGATGTNESCGLEFITQMADQTQTRKGRRSGVARLARFPSGSCYKSPSARCARQDNSSHSPALKSLYHDEQLCEIGAGGCHRRDAVT